MALDPFLAPASGSTTSAAADTPASDQPTEAAAPDLSALSAVNADVTARLAGLALRGLELGATTLRLQLQNGKLESSFSPASLYGGTVRGKLDLLPPARRGPYSFALGLTLDGVDVDQVLTRLNGTSKLSGAADFTANMNGPLLGGDALMWSLHGDGRFMFRNGAIKGVNIAAILRLAKSLLGGLAGCATDELVSHPFWCRCSHHRRDLLRRECLCRDFGAGCSPCCSAYRPDQYDGIYASAVERALDAPAADAEPLVGRGDALCASCISQMDIPTRQAYTMAVVEPDERSAASGVTTVARSLGASLSPLLVGPMLANPALMGLPFFLAGGIKIVYDLLLYRQFVKVPER